MRRVALFMAACSLLTAAVRAEPPTIRDAATDQFLKARVLGALALSPDVSMRQLGVDVVDGVAILTGSVRDAVERDRALAIAREVPGIQDAKSQLRLQGPTPDEVARANRAGDDLYDDDRITHHIRGELLSDPKTTGSAIEVHTRERVVTLRGAVESESQRQRADHIARTTPRVAAVHNELAITH